LFEAYDRNSLLPICRTGTGWSPKAPASTSSPGGRRPAHAERGVLHGITRKTAIEIAEESGVEMRVEDLPVIALYRARKSSSPPPRGA